MKGFAGSTLSLAILFCLILNVICAKYHEQNDSNQTNGEDEDILIRYNLTEIAKFKNNTLTRLEQTLKGKDPNTEEYSHAVFKFFSEVNTVSLKLQVIEYLIPQNQLNRNQEKIIRLLDVFEYLKTNYSGKFEVIEDVRTLIETCALQDLPITENFSSTWYKDLYNRQSDIANSVTKKTIDIMYHYESINFLVNRIIFELPTLEAKVLQMENLWNVIRQSNDIFSDKIFQYAKLYKIFEDLNKGWLIQDNLVNNVTLPQCVYNVIYHYDRLCFDNGEYIFSSYGNNNFFENYFYDAPHAGVCKNHTLKTESHYLWYVLGFISNNSRILDSYNHKRILLEVQFEVAPDEQRCYIKIKGKYLYKNGDTGYLDLVDNKTLADTWNVETSNVSSDELYSD